MTSIHPIAYVVIGMLMAVYSKFVAYKGGSGSLDLFFWVGILLIIIGLGKFGWRKTRKATEVKIKNYENQYEKLKQNFQQEHQRLQQQNFPPPVQQQNNYPTYEQFRR